MKFHSFRGRSAQDSTCLEKALCLFVHFLQRLFRDSWVGAPVLQSGSRDGWWLVVGGLRRDRVFSLGFGGK